MQFCFCQELCSHYNVGDNKPPNHDVRTKYPCRHWLAMDCEKIFALAELQEYCTGQPMACKIDKIHRLKKELGGG